MAPASPPSRSESADGDSDPEANWQAAGAEGHEGQARFPKSGLLPVRAPGQLDDAGSAQGRFRTCMGVDCSRRGLGARAVTSTLNLNTAPLSLRLLNPAGALIPRQRAKNGRAGH